MKKIRPATNDFFSLQERKMKKCVKAIENWYISKNFDLLTVNFNFNFSIEFAEAEQ